MWKFINVTRVQPVEKEQATEDAESFLKKTPSITSGKSFVRKISRSRSLHFEKITTDNAKEDGDQKGKKVTQSGSSGDSLQQKPQASNKNCELKPRHARFGPYYRNDQSITMEDNKKRSLAKAFGITNMNQGGDDRIFNEMKMKYEGEIKEAVIKAREQYADSDELTNVNIRQFREMMMTDGCFFLQLAVLVLEFKHVPEYPSEGVPIFGGRWNKNDVRVFIESMFFIGNQIPFVVLHGIIGTNDFFSSGAFDRVKNCTTSGYCEKVLYDLVTGKYNKPVGEVEQEPSSSDCLHALHEIVLGPVPAKTDTSAGINQKDLEANITSDFLDVELEESSQISTTRAAEKTRMFESATTLRGSFIFIRKLKKGDGVRRIHFKSYYFFAFLYLPEFPTAAEAPTVLRNLIAYETSQKVVGGYSRGEVTSYIRMMSDILQTTDDVKYLREKKIVQYSDDEELYEDDLPLMLEKLSNQEAALTYDFRILKHRVANYSGPPWTRIKSILNLVALLTVLQTFFAVLAYVRPPKP